MFSGDRQLKTSRCRRARRPSGASAFQQTGLQELHIPASVTKIEGQAFEGTALTSVEVPERSKRSSTAPSPAATTCAVSHWAKVSGACRMVCCPAAARSEARHAAAVARKKIDDYAFSECPRLTGDQHSGQCDHLWHPLLQPHGPARAHASGGARPRSAAVRLPTCPICASCTSRLRSRRSASACSPATARSRQPRCRPASTEIPESTFAFCEKLTSVAIPRQRDEHRQVRPSKTARA